MAKRIGKYKVSSQESALSLEDGGTIAGALTVSTATIKFTGLAGGVKGSSAPSASLAANQLFRTGSNTFKSGSAEATATMQAGHFDIVCITQ